MDLFEYIMKYLKDNFDFEDSDNFVKNTFGNFIDYAVKNFNNSEDQLAYYLSDMIDGLEFEKIKKEISNYEKNKDEIYKQKEKREKIVNYSKNEFNIPIIEKVEKIIKKDEDYNYHDEMKVYYILLDNKNKSQSHAVVELDCDDWISVNLKNKEINDIFDYAYSMDEDIFGELESGKKIAYMSLDFHYYIWRDVHYYYPEDIQYKDGLQMYLQYCKDNGIDMNLLNEVMDAEKFNENLCDFVSSKDKNLEI